jgi:hypothetical protein
VWVKTWKNGLHQRPVVERHVSPHDDIVDLLEHIGEDHRDRSSGLLDRYPIAHEPLLPNDGEVIAGPLFGVKVRDMRFACFGKATATLRVEQKLEGFGIKLIDLGEKL